MKKFTIILLLFTSVICSAQLNTNHVIHTGRSRLYFGNYTGAIQSFNMVIKINPHLPEPYFYRGVAKLNLEDFRGAKRDLDKALEIKPFYAEAIMYRGIVHYNLREYEKAMNDYSEAMNLDGENADIYNNRGICKAAMRDFDGAIQDYSKAIELKPKNYNAYLNRSIAYQIKEEWDKAIADCNQLIRIRPNSPMGYMSRGLIKVEKNDFAAAIRDFDMAIYLDPQNSFAYQNRGMVKQQLGSYESAIMDYDMAISIDPQQASTYFNRGIAKEMISRDGYQKDYDTASLLDSRFAKRPWQTNEEREKAQQQQLLAWKQQAQQQNRNNQTINSNNTVVNPDDESEEKVEENIDYNDLLKRKNKAALIVEETQKQASTDGFDPGRVQNNNISIELLPMFDIVNMNRNSTDNENIGYFSMVLENLNAKNNYQPFLMLSNKSNNSSTDYYQNQVLIYDERIKQNPTYSDNFLYRGIFKTLLGNYQSAINDYSKAILLNEHNLLAYFMRANSNAKMISEVEKIKRKTKTENSLNNTAQPLGSGNKNNSFKNESFDEIITDYQVVLYMNPDFYVCYYNKGNIYCENDKYLAAIEEYNKAINIEPDFAEAYYNRGLVKILLNDIEGGAKDLSKAGELGIVESYSVIKRHCN